MALNLRNTAVVLLLTATLTGANKLPACAQDSVDPHATETKQQRDSRLKWLREARFGMFIHWGLYSVPAGTWKDKRIGGIGEWIMNTAKIPVSEYGALAAHFNPTQFNADQWAQIAADAGMKYVVITSKHHDGFAMFHSLSDPYNIYDATPFKRDPIAELAAACRKRGIKFGVYYSQAQDWHHAGGAAYGGHWDKAQDGDIHEYVRKVAAPQVSELLSRYHPAVLWWDTPVPMSPEDIRLLTAGFAKERGLIANNRLGNGVPGDTETPEQFIPATGFKGRDWETCMTINDTWGYKSYDTNFKSSETLLRNLIDIASKGGNYLLNVGPDSTGVIPQPEVERLLEVGKWMKENGATIYGTTASPYKRLPFEGRATVKGNSLFLNVFEWPKGDLVLAGLKTPVRSAHVVATGEKLNVTASKNTGIEIVVSKPANLDPLSTAIELKLAGPPVVEQTQIGLAPRTDGSFLLAATDAELQGDAIKLENENIGFWTNAAEAPFWKIKVPAAAAGKFTVKLEIACEPGSAGSTYEIQADGKRMPVVAHVEATRSWLDYHVVSLPGSITLTEGDHTIRVNVLSMPHGAVMNLKNIQLTPMH